MIKIKLYDLLQSRRWTQKKLAEKAEIREATISQMCNNSIARLNVEHLDKICSILDCELWELVEYVKTVNDLK